MSVSSLRRNSHQANTGYTFLVPAAIILKRISPLSPWVYQDLAEKHLIVTSTETTIAALTTLGNDGKCPLRMTQRAEAGLQSRLVKDARSLVLWVLRLITDVASGGTLTG